MDDGVSFKKAPVVEWLLAITKDPSLLPLWEQSMHRASPAHSLPAVFPDKVGYKPFMNNSGNKDLYKALHFLPHRKVRLYFPSGDFYTWFGMDSHIHVTTLLCDRMAFYRWEFAELNPMFKGCIQHTKDASEYAIDMRGEPIKQDDYVAYATAYLEELCVV